ncbi:uncharacterized protein ACMZJ9_011775 [Mantella aurantiaca]
MNRTIKDKLRKATGGTFKRWEKYIPAVLAEIRMTPTSSIKLSPFEILMGRPFPTPWANKKPLILLPGDIEEIREHYVAQLVRVLNGHYGDVSLSFPLPSQEPTHPFRPGDIVLVKSLFHHKHKDPPYGKPTTVTAITRTAVLTEDSPSWIHASRVKMAPVIQVPEVPEEHVETEDAGFLFLEQLFS